MAYSLKNLCMGCDEVNCICEVINKNLTISEPKVAEGDYIEQGNKEYKIVRVDDNFLGYKKELTFYSLRKESKLEGIYIKK